MIFNKRDLRRLRGVNLKLALIFYEAQRTCPYDIHVGYLGGYRTPEQQNELYRRDKSKKDGYRKLSKHQKGMAIDFVPYSGSNAIWDVEVYTVVADHIMYVAAEKFNTQLRWGADWNMNGIRVDKDPNEKFLDAGHLELV